MKSLKDFNYLLSLDRRYTKTESEIFRQGEDRQRGQGQDHADLQRLDHREGHPA